MLSSSKGLAGRTARGWGVESEPGHRAAAPLEENEPQDAQRPVLLTGLTLQAGFKLLESEMMFTVSKTIYLPCSQFSVFPLLFDHYFLPVGLSTSIFNFKQHRLYPRYIHSQQT